MKVCMANLFNVFYAIEIKQHLLFTPILDVHITTFTPSEQHVSVLCALKPGAKMSATVLVVILRVSDKALDKCFLINMQRNYAHLQVALKII